MSIYPLKEVNKTQYHTAVLVKNYDRCRYRLVFQLYQI
jgi:hypothetical protein